LLLVLVPLAFWWFCLRPVPNFDGREQIAGLDKEVAVEYDAHGVPYIQARSESDAYIAQGFVTARERMFQMDILRRSAIGQMSEVFGSVALPTDRLVRTLGIAKLAAQEFHELSPPAKQAVDAYTRGVNAYLSQNAGRLGVEFTLLGYTPAAWHPEDCMAILKYLGYRSDESWRLDDFRQRVANKIGEKQAAALFRDDIATFGLPAKTESTTTSPRSTALLDDLERFGEAVNKAETQKTSWGSTAFALPNMRTQTRGATVACDKHGPLTAPAEYFVCSMNSPSLHVAGATIPGVPGIWVGRNEDIAWGSASLKADVQDIYLEQFNSPFDISYRVGSKWTEAGVRTEAIPVRLGKDVEHKIIATRHGPVLLRNGDVAISLSWTGVNTDKPTFDALYSVNHARSWEEFSAALTRFVDPPQMFVYADRWGNVGSQAAGLIPVRTNATQGTMLMLGTEPNNKWNGFVPFEKLPREYVTAGSTAKPLIAANQLPSKAAALLGHQWNAPYRANRLLATLSLAKLPVTIADMNVLQGDEYSPVAAILAKSLQQSANATNYIDRNGLQAIDLFLSWDGQLKPGSVEASVYEAYLQTLVRRLVEPRLGREMATEYLQRWPMWKPLAESVIKDRPAGWTPPEERSYDVFFLTTLSQAMKSLKIAFAEPDPTKWAWGKIHEAGFRHVSPNATPLFRSFALGPVPVGGDADTLNSCDVQEDPRGLHYNSESGPTQRMIVDMADRDKFYEALSTGQSGHRFSQYRDDQIKAWQRVDLAPIAFSSDQLMRMTKHRLVLENKY
jgi:penicillin amidase